MTAAFLPLRASEDRAPADRELPSVGAKRKVDTPPIKVIYIAGYGRSGTTLLDISVGQHAAIMGAGEVSTLARHVWENDEYCACGAPVHDCPTWAAVVERWRIDDTPELMAEYRRAQESTEGIFGFGRLRQRFGRQDHARRTVKLLRSMAAVSGRPILLDSSKLPGRGFLLSGIVGVDLHVVHVVRDGRGVGWSLAKGHRRQVDQGLQRELRPKPLLYTALRWATVNLATEMLCRRLGSSRAIRVRYEDFVTDPTATVRRIVELVGEAMPDTAPVDGRTLMPQHQVAGSRHRMQRSITLQADEKWRDEMPRYKQILFTLVCWPMLRRYGYALKPAFSGRWMS